MAPSIHQAVYVSSMVSTEEHEARILLTAATVACQSLCLRSRCGASLFRGNLCIGIGFNGPPNNNLEHRKCGQTVASKGKPKSDRTCCLHAEWRALFSGTHHTERSVALQEVEHGTALEGSTLYFARINAAGQLQKSGKPYCTVCSRLALEFKVQSWVLWHPEGIRVYDAAEYNELSHRYDEEWEKEAFASLDANGL